MVGESNCLSLWSRITSWLGLSFKTILAVGILIWICYKLDTREILRTLERCDPWWLFLAFVSYEVTIFFSIIRWHILLRFCDADVRWLRTAQLTMIGLFGNAFMLGSMGGDVLKAYYAARDIPRKKAAVIMSIVMERVLGLIGMFILSTTLILFRYKLLTSEPATRFAVYFYFTFMGLLMLIVVLFSMQTTARWFPFSGQLGRIETLKQAGEAYRFFVRHQLCFWGGLFLSLVSHIFLMATFYLAGTAVGLRVGFWDLCAVLPLVNLITLLPITPNGLGVREYAFTHFLGVLNVPMVTALALSLTGFFVILVWNLIGGIVYLFFNEKQVVERQ